MENNHIKASLDNTLSLLQMQSLNGNALLSQAKGGKKVKRKLSVATVLIIALIAISITAFAIVSLQLYYERIVEKEGSYGLIENWSAKDHIEFVELMAEAGVKLSENELAQMRNTALNVEARGKIAWEIIQKHYPARDGKLTSIDIIAKEKGPVEYWTLEDKAWYSELMLKHQPDEVVQVNLLPGKDDISQAQAEEIFFAHYKEKHGLTKDDFNLSTLFAFFTENHKDQSQDIKQKQWIINVDLKDGSGDVGAYIRANGEMIAAVEPYNMEPGWKSELDYDMRQPNFFTVAGLNDFDKKWRSRMQQLVERGEDIEKSDLPFLLEEKAYGLPEKDDISRDDAFSLACAAIQGNEKWPNDVLSYYSKLHEAYRIERREKPVYWFTFFRTSEESLFRAAMEKELPVSITVTVNAKSGEVESIHDKGKFFTSPYDRFGM